jgi:mRNA interferase RelE/StbE
LFFRTPIFSTVCSFISPKIEDDLKELDSSLQIQVFKKLKQIQISPELGLPLGNKNNMNLSGFKKVYLAKKRVRIVYEIQDDELLIYTIAIGKRDDMEVYKKANERL